MQDIFKFLLDNLYVIGGAILFIILLIFISRIKNIGHANRIPSALNGRGDLDNQGKNKIVIEFHKKIFFVFRLWAGTITYDLTYENLFVSYETRRENGERVIALDSIYNTGIFKQKRRLWLLVVAITVALLTAFSALAVWFLNIVDYWVTIVGALTTVIFVLLWFFQKRAIGFSIMFGGSGEVGSRFLTSSKKNEDIITEYLIKVGKAAVARREELSAKSLLNTLTSQKALITSIRDGLLEHGLLPQSDLFGGFSSAKNIHSYNNASNNPMQNVGMIHTYNNATQSNNTAQSNNNDDNNDKTLKNDNDSKAILLRKTNN